MRTIELIFTVLAALMLASSVINDILWAVYLKKNKNTSPVFSLSSIVIDFLLIGVFTFSFVRADNGFKPFWLMMLICMVVSIPTSTGSVITEKGLGTFSFCFKMFIPAESVKYQYKGKLLELYPNNQKRTYRFNINNIKTVKLLADWYPKYEFINPLISDNDDQE
ncbi:MAG TPA: hypothetical protein P5191_12860 [Ruminococcus sp.]|nr:hypothetical protein [Ruminococcus sp.]